MQPAGQNGAMPFRKIPHAQELRPLVADLFAAGASMRQVAREIGLPASTVCRWIAGGGMLEELRRANESQKIALEIRCRRHWLEYFRNPRTGELPAAMAEMYREEQAMREEAFDRVRVRLQALRVASPASPAEPLEAPAA